MAGKRKRRLSEREMNKIKCSFHLEQKNMSQNTLGIKELDCYNATEGTFPCRPFNLPLPTQSYLHNNPQARASAMHASFICYWYSARGLPLSCPTVGVTMA